MRLFHTKITTCFTTNFTELFLFLPGDPLPTLETNKTHFELLGEHIAFFVGSFQADIVPYSIRLVKLRGRELRIPTVFLPYAKLF